MVGPRPDFIVLGPSGAFPNSSLPVLFYRDTGLRDAAEAERTFAANDWRDAWRDGIFRYHHFHSTAHEALAIVAGRASVVLGGPDGTELQVRGGDVLVLPAGTGHCLTGSDSALLVVGAYPRGSDWDVRRGDPAEADEVAANLAAVPRPGTDPLSGAAGPLPTLWDG